MSTLINLANRGSLSTPYLHDKHILGLDGEVHGYGGQRTMVDSQWHLEWI